MQQSKAPRNSRYEQTTPTRATTIPSSVTATIMAVTRARITINRMTRQQHLVGHVLHAVKHHEVTPQAGSKGQQWSGLSCDQRYHNPMLNQTTLHVKYHHHHHHNLHRFGHSTLSASHKIVVKNSNMSPPPPPPLPLLLLPTTKLFHRPAMRNDSPLPSSRRH